MILSGDFVAHLANEEDLGAFGAGGRSEEWSPRAHRAGLLPRAKSKELPLFYLEMEQGKVGGWDGMVATGLSFMA